MKDELRITVPYINQDKFKVTGHISTCKRYTFYAHRALLFILFIIIMYGLPLIILKTKLSAQAQLICMPSTIIIITFIIYIMMHEKIGQYFSLPEMSIDKEKFTYTMVDRNLNRKENTIKWGGVIKLPEYTPEADIELLEVDTKNSRITITKRYIKLFERIGYYQQKIQLEIPIDEINKFSNKNEIFQAIIANLAMHPKYNLSISEGIFYHGNINPKTLEHINKPLRRRYSKIMTALFFTLLFFIFMLVVHCSGMSKNAMTFILIFFVVVIIAVGEYLPKVKDFFSGTPRVKKFTYIRPNRS